MGLREGATPHLGAASQGQCRSPGAGRPPRQGTAGNGAPWAARRPRSHRTANPPPGCRPRRSSAGAAPRCSCDRHTAGWHFCKPTLHPMNYMPPRWCPLPDCQVQERMGPLWNIHEAAAMQTQVHNCMLQAGPPHHGNGAVAILHMYACAVLDRQGCCPSLQHMILLRQRWHTCSSRIPASYAFTDAAVFLVCERIRHCP